MHFSQEHADRFQSHLEQGEHIRWTTSPVIPRNQRIIALTIVAGIALLLIYTLGRGGGVTPRTSAGIMIFCLIYILMTVWHKRSFLHVCYACTNRRLLAYDYFSPYKLYFPHSLFLMASAAYFKAIDLNKITDIAVEHGAPGLKTIDIIAPESRWDIELRDIRNADIFIQDIREAIAQCTPRPAGLQYELDMKQDETNRQLALIILAAFPVFVWWAWPSLSQLWTGMTGF